MSKTPLRAVRIDQQLWDAAQTKATEQQRNVSEVIRTQLSEWVEEPEATK